MAGIVIACVLGAATLAWALGDGSSSATEWGAELKTVSRGMHMVGCIALICGALLSLARHRAGNAVVRATSWGMIAGILWLQVMAWRAARVEEQAEGGMGTEALLAVLGVAALFGTAQWMLYLYLFRKSKYP